MSNFPKFPTGLIIFGLVIIFAPALIAYAIGIFIIFIGTNIWYISYKLNKNRKNKKDNEKEFVKFGDYKIFRGGK
ncbi:MAG: hypothetical protein Q9M94_01165 [Candidatus Gracilibacteria bacterium]|nr:hypothetical protein [Candidatus Gracilibacteria bacterium]